MEGDKDIWIVILVKLAPAPNDQVGFIGLCCLFSEYQEGRRGFSYGWTGKITWI